MDVNWKVAYNIKDKLKDDLLSVPKGTHIVTLFTFIFRFLSLNLIHMKYSDYTDIIFTRSLHLKHKWLQTLATFSAYTA